MFPDTFLDRKKIAKEAGSNVLSRIRKEALGWVALIAFLFLIVQLVANIFRPERTELEATKKQLEALKIQHQAVQERLLKLEKEGSALVNPKSVVPAPPVNIPSKQPTK